MLGDVISGDGLQNGCRSTSMEVKEDLLNHALDFPADFVSAAHLLSPRAHGAK